MKKTLLALVLGIPLSLQAQELLTINKAVETALERNHNLLSAQYDLTASRWGKWNSVTNYLPKVELASSATRIDEDTYLRANAAVDFIKLGAAAIPGIPPGAVDNIKPFAYRNSYQTNLTVVQPIYNGGLEIVGLRASGAVKERSEYSYEDTEQDVISKVRTMYYNVLKADEFVGLATESLDRTERYLATTKRRADLGTRTQTDVLRWEVQRSADEANLIMAKNQLALAKLQLNDLMGLDLQHEFTLEKIVTADSASLASADSTGGTGELAQPSSTAHLTIDQLAGHPSMRAMDANLQLAGIGISKEWSNFLPRVNLVYQYGWENNGSIQLDGIKPWALVLSVKYPIFSSFSDFTSLERSYAEYNRTEEQIESFKTGLVMQATNAQLNLLSARKRIETTRKGFRQAIDVLNSVTRRYDTGGASSIDVIDVQTAYTLARTNYIGAVYDYYISQIQYERATGTIHQ